MSRKVHYIQATLFTENSQNSVGITYSQRYAAKIKALDSVIKKLRKDDLEQGYCFMFFDENLPEDQAYYEYPDGSIKIEKLDRRNIEIPRVVIKTLNKNEAATIKRRYAIFA